MNFSKMWGSRRAFVLLPLPWDEVPQRTEIQRKQEDLLACQTPKYTWGARQRCSCRRLQLVLLHRMRESRMSSECLATCGWWATRIASNGSPRSSTLTCELYHRKTICQISLQNQNDRKNICCHSKSDKILGRCVWIHLLVQGTQRRLSPSKREVTSVQKRKLHVPSISPLLRQHQARWVQGAWF